MRSLRLKKRRMGRK